MPTLGPCWHHVYIFTRETATIERDGSINRSLSSYNFVWFILGALFMVHYVRTTPTTSLVTSFSSYSYESNTSGTHFPLLAHTKKK